MPRKPTTPTSVKPYTWQSPLLYRPGSVWCFERGIFVAYPITSDRAKAELKRLQNPDQLQATLNLYADCVYMRDVCGATRLFKYRTIPQSAENGKA